MKPFQIQVDQVLLHHKHLQSQYLGIKMVLDSYNHLCNCSILRCIDPEQGILCYPQILLNHHFRLLCGRYEGIYRLLYLYLHHQKCKLIFRKVKIEAITISSICNDVTDFISFHLLLSNTITKHNLIPFIVNFLKRNNLDSAFTSKMFVYALYT